MDVLSGEVRDLGLDSDSDKNEERLISLALRTFSMAHILENVFSHLNRKTVLICRFVSHRWAVLGCQEAQKQNRWFQVQRDPETKRPILCSKSNRKLLLSDLITLMNDSTTGFPCNSFIICSPLFKNPVVQQFLNVHGGHIKRLVLPRPPDVVTKQEDPIHAYEVQYRIDKAYKQTITFSNLTRLLLVQCPQVEMFYCYARIEEKAKANREKRDDPDELTAMIWRLKEKNPDFKFNLKVFVMLNRSVFPEKLLQAILMCSPHLKNITLEVRNFHNLVQPVNRLHLLKAFMLRRNEFVDTDCLNALDKTLQHAEGNWVMRILYLDGSCLFDKPYLWSKVTRIINRILRGVSASNICTTFVYHGLDFLEGIRIPQMRSVECLSLFVRKGLKTLPGGATVGYTFPNLRSLSIHCKIGSDELYPLVDLFNSLEPMPQVEAVHLRGFKKPEFAERVKGIFPNAQVVQHSIPWTTVDERIAKMINYDYYDFSKFPST